MQPDARQPAPGQQRSGRVPTLVDDRQQMTGEVPGTRDRDDGSGQGRGEGGELRVERRLGADNVVGDPLENVADAQSSSILGRTCSQTSLVQAAGSSPIGIMVTVVIPSAAYAAISLRNASVSLSGSTTLIIVFSMAS